VKRAVFLLLVTTTGISGLLVARGLIPFVSISPDTLPAIFGFLRGPHSLLIAATGLMILALILYADILVRLLAGLFRVVLAPVFDEQRDVNRRLTRQMEDTEKKVNDTEQALGKFSMAISHYAEHLSSHTSAIKGLAEASHELKEGAAVHNRVLLNLIQSAEERLARQEELQATLKMSSATTAEPEIPLEDPTQRKARPSYRALHPKIKSGTTEKDSSGFEVANLVEAMVLPYYLALNDLEPQKSKTERMAEAARKAAEDIVEPIFQPYYRTEIDQPRPEQDKPDTGIRHPRSNYRQHHQMKSR
jgi:hypothetical protein